MAAWKVRDAFEERNIVYDHLGRSRGWRMVLWVVIRGRGRSVSVDMVVDGSVLVVVVMMVRRIRVTDYAEWGAGSLVEAVMVMAIKVRLYFRGKSENTH